MSGSSTTPVSPPSQNTCLFFLFYPFNTDSPPGTFPHCHLHFRPPASHVNPRYHPGKDPQSPPPPRFFPNFLPPHFPQPFPLRLPTPEFLPLLFPLTSDALPKFRFPFFDLRVTFKHDFVPLPSLEFSFFFFLPPPPLFRVILQIDRSPLPSHLGAPHWFGMPFSSPPCHFFLGPM